MSERLQLPVVSQNIMLILTLSLSNVKINKVIVMPRHLWWNPAQCVLRLLLGAWYAMESHDGNVCKLKLIMSCRDLCTVNRIDIKRHLAGHLQCIFASEANCIMKLLRYVGSVNQVSYDQSFCK